MPKRKKTRSMTRVSSVQSKKSIRSDNVHITLTPSIFQKARNPGSRSLAKKSSSIASANKSTRSVPTVTNAMRTFPTSGIPENTAVHFGNYYDLQVSPNFDYSKSDTRKIEAMTNGTPKSDFTRQMVYKLERSAGTEHYARQVSALLEETVEPPDFKVRPPPADNCVPYGKPASSYPLWYKDPNKMPHFATMEYRSIKKKYGKLGQKTLTKTKRMDVIERSGDEGQNFSNFENEDDLEEDLAESSKESIFGGHFLKSNAGPESSVTLSSSTMTGNSVSSAKFVKSSRALEAIDLGNDADSEDEDEDDSSGWETIDENVDDR